MNAKNISFLKSTLNALKIFYKNKLLKRKSYQIVWVTQM